MKQRPFIVCKEFIMYPVKGNMEIGDRLKTYTTMAETSRKWVSVMDAKASFLTALAGSTLVFVWTGAKLTEAPGYSRSLALSATALLLVSLALAVWVVLPRISLKQAFGRRLTYSNTHKPISYFGYVAEEFPADKHKAFVEIVDAMDDTTLAREALEQHYTICHVLRRKSLWVTWAGWVWLLALIQVVLALILRA
jgi:Family of unknown function (DUF5706)